ncbi:MAG: hypothetical protein K2W33_16050 [Burkholderiales bacterium]|nr:hypothetical protein [Burkholderiales bacterium]
MSSRQPSTPPTAHARPSAATLRAHLADVTHHRAEAVSHGLTQALATIRHIQVQRFRDSYADLLADPLHARATQFFLAELYGEQDYTERDAQFARIAGAVERLFPDKVMTLAVELAEVHALTEELDWCMARTWQELKLPDQRAGTTRLARGYTTCWAHVGRPADRQHQLEAVLRMGWRLADVVRVPGLRMALRLMRGPANAAGLAALQHVLEEGFDAFRSMGTADTFLTAIENREGAWLRSLFNTPDVAAAQLSRALRPDELSETTS